MIEHKFKYTLRNLLKIYRDDHVLIAFSGGPNSLALLKMISETLWNPGPKKMFFTAQVLHIDEEILYEKNKQEIQRVSDFCSLNK